MAQTHDLGRLYVTKTTFPELEELPLAVRGWTAETDEPWRIGKCLILRVPFSRTGLAIGWWGAPTSEYEALTLATGMRQLTDEEVDSAEIFLA